MDSSNRLGLWVGGAGIAACLAVATPAQANVIAQEGFGEYGTGLPPDYYSGSPGPNTAITSWYSIGGNPWGDDTGSGSISYPSLTPVADAAANDLQGTGSGLDVTAAVDTSAGGLFGQNGFTTGAGTVGAPGKTLYFSFTSKIFSSGGGAPDVNNSGGDDQAFLQLGNSSGATLTLGQGGSNFTANGVALAPLTNGDNLVVVEMNFGATPSADTAEVYFDPTSGYNLSTLLPTTVLTGPMEFNYIDFKQEVNEMNWDDLRFGTTFADVTPGFTAVPEPISMIVLSPAALLMLRRKRT